MPRVDEKAHTRVFTMSDEHKASLAVGREQSRVIREYLATLDQNQSPRGRRRSVESIQRRLDEIATQLPSEDDPLRRVQMIAEREGLEATLEKRIESTSLPELEEAFIGVVKDYSNRKRIGYRAWREAGVDAAVLKRAGLTRAS